MTPNQRMRESGERVLEVRGMGIRTKFLWLPEAPKLGDRLKGWRISFVVMAERKYGLVTAIAPPPPRTVVVNRRG